MKKSIIYIIVMAITAVITLLVVTAIPTDAADERSTTTTIPATTTTSTVLPYEECLPDNSGVPGGGMYEECVWGKTPPAPSGTSTTTTIPPTTVLPDKTTWPAPQEPESAPAEKPATTWDALGFGGLTPLTIERVTPGMTACRAYTSNGGFATNVIILQVMEYNLLTEGAEHIAQSPYQVLVEASYVSSLDNRLVAYWELYSSDGIGLTGSLTDTNRMYAGTCEEPISSEEVIVESLPETL